MCVTWSCVVILRDDNKAEPFDEHCTLRLKNTCSRFTTQNMLCVKSSFPLLLLCPQSKTWRVLNKVLLTALKTIFLGLITFSIMCFLFTLFLWQLFICPCSPLLFVTFIFFYLSWHGGLLLTLRTFICLCLCCCRLSLMSGLMSFP